MEKVRKCTILESANPCQARRHAIRKFEFRAAVPYTPSLPHREDV